MDPINSDFEFYEEVLDVPPLELFSDFDMVLWHLGGSVRPVGADSKVLKYWFPIYNQSHCVC